MESMNGDHMEGTSQPVPEMVTRKELNQFTANITNILHLQQKMMDDMMQRLARHEPAPSPKADTPYSEARGLGESYTAG